MIGDHLGKWVIYKELGRGGMGQVFLAQEEMSGRVAALKVLAAELAQDPGFLERFRREIDTLSRLDHPHIVHFYESGFENGLNFYAMEYVEGQSLDDVLEERGRLPWDEVLDIALQVCPALKHAHDHGIIHRDLKPGNLLRTAAGVVKLGDFGIAKVFAGTHLTATGGVVGTAEYLSPEQAAGKPVTKRSDLYSFGVVLYTLLTGAPPFEGASILDLLHKHRYGQFDPPRKRVPEIPYEVDEIVCRLLEKDPAQRPADALVLGRQLEGVRHKLERKSHRTAVGPPDEETLTENRREAEASGPGPATLMSRLMREELERQNRGSVLSQLMTKPLVVVPLFFLCIGLIVWALWPASAASLYEHGAALMASDQPARWDEAWRDYFEPLNRRFPDHPYHKEVEEFRRRIEEAHRAAEAPPAVNDARRFFHQAERLRQAGDVAAARRTWQAVVDVFAAVPSEEEWVRRSLEALQELDREAADARRWEPVRSALKHAAALAAEGKRDQAETIWRGIEALYRGDPSAGDILAAVQAARGQGAKR
jgi:serine/threonine-protein kinase